MTTSSPKTSYRSLTDDELLQVQEASTAYFQHELNEENGLIPDRSTDLSICSIAAVGLGLTVYPIAVEHGLMQRQEAIERTLKALRFFSNSKQSADADATGFHGLYYHFLDMRTGLRAKQSELSTIDSALLLVGALTAAEYFRSKKHDEAEIRKLAGFLYERADWAWALNGEAAICHGWTPESGFLGNYWYGYCEALLLYLLALGSPTFSIPESSYEAWTSQYRWRTVYGHDYLFAGPLFIHQLSHLWVDFRGIQDAFMREYGIDYFENSRRATYIQQEYAIQNPKGFKAYDEVTWGLTACHGPDEESLKIDGVQRSFLGYAARGVPDGPDDGTLAPWAVAASLPFAPEIVLPTLAHFLDIKLGVRDRYGFKATFNPTHPDTDDHPGGWVSDHHYGLNQGPIAVMVENYRSGMIWRLMRGCQPLVKGLDARVFAADGCNSFSHRTELQDRHSTVRDVNDSASFIHNVGSVFGFKEIDLRATDHRENEHRVETGHCFEYHRDCRAQHVHVGGFLQGVHSAT